MRRPILCIAIFLVLLVSFASAFTIDMAETQKQIDTYNRNIDRAPEVLKSILGDEKINLEVLRKNASTFQVGLDVKSARIDRIIEGGWDDPSITITASEEAIDNVRLSNDPIGAFEKERDAGSITFKANNLISRAKLKAAFSSTSVLQFGYDTFFG